MSSTNRGAIRVESDFYSTPLKSFNPLLPYLPKDKLIWEPAKGDGRLVKRMDEYGLKADGNDLSQGYDFLLDNNKWPCIVTNPPFSIAKSFVTHALELSDEVYFLLRLNFLGSKERKVWWGGHKPNAIFILSDRPNFVKSLKCKKKCGFKQTVSIETPTPKECPKCKAKVNACSSDSCEYGWYAWTNKYSGLIWL